MTDRNASSSDVHPVSSLSFCGVVCASRRPSRISSRSPQWSASSITWLDTSRVVPRRASSWNWSHRSTRSTGSSPTVGSSSTSNSGCVTSAQASETRVRCPPERLPHKAVRWSVRPTASTASSAAFAVGPVQRREVAHVVDHPQVVVDGGVLRDIADAAAQFDGSGGPAEHRDRARRDELRADDAPHQRRLAAAGRTEQPGDGAPGDPHRDVVQGSALAANHRQMVDRNGGLGTRWINSSLDEVIMR